MEYEQRVAQRRSIRGDKHDPVPLDVMRGFRQFDAPVSVVVTCDRALADDTIAHFDCGAATYGLVLAATSKGLGCELHRHRSTGRPMRARPRLPSRLEQVEKGHMLPDAAELPIEEINPLNAHLDASADHRHPHMNPDPRNEP